jgi:leucyl-tRNA synthetase
LEFPADADNETIQNTVLAHESTQKWMDGKPARKIIIVPKKIVNIVL